MRVLAYEQGFNGTWVFRVFAFEEDRYGIYHGLNKQVAFIEVMAKFHKRNAEILERAREETPEVLTADVSSR